ncbi:hypothetical protein JCM10908_001617 [Rhodotorula pacifica]|uniref:HMG-box domain-containing protein n=1 Tax=Rhodotorula pacifica TaxID=1495444 RepID=UPI0031785329
MLAANLRSRSHLPTLEMHSGGPLRKGASQQLLASPPSAVEHALESPEAFSLQDTPTSYSLPIPIQGSDAGVRKTTLFRSNSTRHQPYPTSPASTSGRSVGRSRSATSASDFSEWDSESSFCSPDFYGSSVDSQGPSPPTSCEVSRSATVEASPFVVGSRAKTGKNGKPAKSHTRRLDPGYVKRPPNAFILFRSHCCAPEPKGEDAQVPEPPGTAHARHLASLQLSNSQHVSVIVSQVWKSLSADDKAYWEEKARLAKEEHQRLHPDYRFRPKQRAKDPRRRQLVADPQREQEQRQACKEVARQVLQLEGVTLAEADDDNSTGESSRRSSRASSRKKRRSPKKVAQSAQAATAPTSPSPATFEGMLPIDANTPALSIPFAGTPSSASTPIQVLDSPEPWSLYGSAPAGQFTYMSELDAILGNPRGDFTNDDYALDPSLASATASGPNVQHSFASSHHHSFPSVLPSPLTPPQTAPPTTFVLPNPSQAPRTAETTCAGDERFFESRTFETPAIEFNPASPFAPRAPLGSAPISDVSKSLAERRFGPLPSALLSEALQRRRSTIKAANSHGTRGDLMLISPVVTTQDGRRQSLGFNSGLRRLSVADQASNEEELPTPRAIKSFPRGSISAGVLSATETFETFTFPQSVLDSLPAEDLGLFDLFTNMLGEQTADGSPTGSDAALRPSTAGSTWSDDGVDRMQGEVPPSFLARRRSTLIPIQFTSPFASSPSANSKDAGANSQFGFHIGPTDLFHAPATPIPSGIACEADSPDGRDGALLAAFGSPEMQHFSQFASSSSSPALLPSMFSSPFDSISRVQPTMVPDVPVNVASADEAWHSTPSFNPPASAADMREAALNVLGDRRRAESALQLDLEVSPAPSSQARAEPECQYVYLTLAQLEDTELMMRIHQQGFGIAFDAGSLDSPPDFPVSA